MNAQNSANNLNSNIEVLLNELENLYFAAEYISNSIRFNVEEIQLLEELSSSYNEGVIICLKYFYNILNLEQFCEGMMQADLKRFLEDILFELLPDEITQKYKLYGVKDVRKDDEKQ